ncbi:autotransporter outer membrane beta-barrel domain-containing protein [Polynucleobacter acidiphobus]|uniref:autotransporter outer membrane beta-barrel domain-containing protein n=1 Tax=Polynucleobacter acidiphobus TaxID=556053 RepID=UPI00131F33D9|nr:autotransporter outer membrane beta-barrel domain-containing protein [Polynucleobacter acidiphobus]
MKPLNIYKFTLFVLLGIGVTVSQKAHSWSMTATPGTPDIVASGVREDLVLIGFWLVPSGYGTILTNTAPYLNFGVLGLSNPVDTTTILNNLGGLGNNGPFGFSGRLPNNYNIIVRSPSDYGQLALTSPNGSTTFGIYGGGISGVSASTLIKGTYAGVLSGATLSNLNNTSGTYNGLTWTLRNSSGTIWDLVVTASTADTQQSLVNTASALQGTFTLQNSVMVNGFTYDCPVFDKHGICVSAGGRNTMVQAQGISNTSGLLIASYRLNKNNSRIGAWVDQNLSVSGPGTVQLGNSTPMIGLFGVWSQRPDGMGAEVKVSAAYGQKDTTITRQVVGTSDPGSGSSQLISQGAQVVAKYGFAVLPDVVVSPYAGVRYTQNNMGGYTEATSSSVTAPLTYSALNTNATTALAGVGASYRGIPKTTLFASAGVETDTNTSNGSYSATGITGLTPVNFNPNPVKTRPTATVGGYYDILKNQRIGITGIYRQEPFQAVSTTTVLATYTIGL